MLDCKSVLINQHLCLWLIFYLLSSVLSEIDSFIFEVIDELFCESIKAQDAEEHYHVLELVAKSNILSCEVLAEIQKSLVLLYLERDEFFQSYLLRSLLHSDPLQKLILHLLINPFQIH